MAEGIVNVPETPGGVAATPKTVEEFRQEQVAEWGTYVATAPIFIDGVRAFNVGDAVPAGHVNSGVVATEQVAKRTTKAGQAVTHPA